MKLQRATRRRRRTIIGLSVVSVMLCPFSFQRVLSQRPRATAENPAQVLFVGTFHFANPGKDVAKLETIDIMSDAKQSEILEVVERLTRFRPTKVAIEATPDRAEELNRLLGSYVEGNHELSTNERQQLGFRVAAALQLSELHSIDHTGTFPIDRVMAYAMEKEPQFAQRFQRKIQNIEEEMNRLQRELTILEMLRELGKPERIELSHSMYVETAALGGGDTYVGADLMTAWVDRNVHIYANLAATAEPNDRILVLFGAGHSYILQDLIRAAPNLVLVDPLKFLEP